MSRATLLAAASLCIACAGAHAQSTLVLATAGPAPSVIKGSAPPDFTEALGLYRAGRFSAAYGRFVVLAAAGQPDAARFALQMLRHGAELYGTEWTAAPSQVAAWERLVGAAAPLQLVYLGE
jgi:hypothetical protein